MPEQDQQAAVIAFLSRPEAFGGAGPVERIDTHGAIVFLAGDRAFKLKRAVRYPYLDFSTLEKRRAVCEEELRLNRRTAPELYLGVRSVNRLADGSLGFGDGEPVDWLVEMRRFDADALLDAVAARGGLDAGLTMRLADRIAAFHAGAEVAQGAAGAARMRAIVDGNRESMARHPDILPADDCARLHDRSRAALDALAPLLDARAAGGHVRHCHGDLHLANICLWQGEPTLFDCLEFDPELATIDVLYDVAFLIMDLCQRGLRGPASLVFNRYFDMTGEGAGVAALPLFLSARAAIRAHVNAAAAGQQADPGKAEVKRGEARAYLTAALGFLDRPEPRLIAIGGFSGTGKSSLAAALAPLADAPPGARWLRTDVLRKRMAGLAPEEDLPAESYTAEASERVYARLMEETRIMLGAGRSVILDGVFAAPGERARVREIAAEQGVGFSGLWLEAPAEVLRRRVAGRSNDPSDATAAVVDLQLSRGPGDLGGWRRLDASGTPEEGLAAARAALEGE